MYQILRNTRKLQDVPVIDIAKKLGFKTTGTYYKKEQGSVPITIKEGKILSKMLHTPMDKLFQ